MVTRMGAVRTLGLGAVTAMVAAGLSVAAAPTTYAADPVFPAPDSASWLVVKKAGNPLSDGAGELDAAYNHLDLTAAGGAQGTAVASLSADLQHAYFRIHVAALPPSPATGAYIIQFDTDNNLGGWERALRYDPAAGTVTVFSAAANSAPTVKGAVVSTTPLTAASRTSYVGAGGGAYVAFALSRSALATAGIDLGAPMVVGATTETADVAGAGLHTSSLLNIPPAKADVLGAGKGSPSWQGVASDPLDIDSDGDGIADRIDNCPVAVNPGQEDDDAAIDNSLPPGTTGVPDGTEGRGNACDTTPRGYDLDGDAVGLLDDQCPEQYGALSNGCVAQSTTTAVLRYKPAAKLFKGTVRADFDQCVPRRSVTVFRSVTGPDKQMGKTVKTDSGGSYAVSLTRRAKRGKYYASVDSKWTLGARCFAVKSPKIEVR
jgi:hypothetical protein